MMKLLRLLLSGCIAAVIAAPSFAESVPVNTLSATSAEKSDSKPATNDASASGTVSQTPTPAATPTPAGTAEAAAAAVKKPKFPPFADVLGDAQSLEGLFKIYRKDSKLYAELGPSNLNRDYLVVMAIARGIAEAPLIGGMSLDFGNDWVWQFRKVDDRIQIVRRNLRFRANKGTPTEKAVYFAYTDSILYSLPIVTQGPGGFVVDLTPVFMSDLPQIGSMLRGFSFSPDRSTWASVKAYRDNVELQVAATFSGGGSLGKSMETVADPRGVSINIHYSISRLPETGYQPRVADDRVGYFLTVIKDFSKPGSDDQFVRYVNRWDLRKAEPGSSMSPPANPIIFWIEKTVPYKYRAPIREGILEWNKAFEKAGFVNAIEVRQQPDDATWDPEDINYNTFRWITSNAGMAMGPSRVNPLTGEILDADIIFDADFIESWTRRFEITPPASKPTKSALIRFSEDGVERPLVDLGSLAHDRHSLLCDCARGMAEQMAFGSIALAADAKTLPKDKIDKLIHEGIRSVAMHEVGHTLGLRHNFKGSTFHTLADLSNPEKTRETGLSASIMDYVPLNISPKDQKQGDYFSTTIGPYDYWAIEYGYKPLSGGTDGEAAELKKIASRCAEPGLDYATDEDAEDGDSVQADAPDPLTNRFDLSKDPIQFAEQRIQVIKETLPKLVDSLVEPGEGYQTVRRGFEALMRDQASVVKYVARFIGGVYVHRDHKGDPNARQPLAFVEPARQRDAMSFLEKNVFAVDSYQFPPALFNFMTTTPWEHWGVTKEDRKDYPLQEKILAQQDAVLERLLEPVTLSRIADAEMKTAKDQDVFTTAELLGRLTSSIFQETEKLADGKFTNREPAVSPARRNLQQRYFQHLADLAMESSNPNGGSMGILIILGASRKPSLPVGQFTSASAAAELKTLRERIKKTLDGKAQLDGYTRAHFEELVARIDKVLDARLELSKP